MVDKNGKPLPGAYILYDYHGYTPGTLGGSSPDYIKNPTIIVTDTNGQFAIPSLSFKKPLGLGRPKLNILAGYSSITHSAFVVKTSGNHQKITLQDNTTNLLAWEKDLNAIEGGYFQLVNDNELGKVKNGEKVEAMLQSERALFNKTGFDSRDLLDKETKNVLALDRRAHEKAYESNWWGAIAEMTYVIEIRTNYYFDYYLRGSWKEKKATWMAHWLISTSRLNSNQMASHTLFVAK